MSRATLAIGLSLGLHAMAAFGLLSVATWQGLRLGEKVEIELVATKVEEVEALPLGPAPPEGGPAAAPKRRRPRVAKKADGLALAGPDAGTAEDASPPGPVAVADAGAAADAQSGLAEGKAPPRDLRDYGPEGSRLTVLLRLDRLRESPEAPATIAAVDGLLRHLPDRRRLLDGTGLDLYRDFDALLIATPNPLDDTVTFLVARHRLEDAAMQEALARGAEAAGRPITWSNQSGRPVGVRVADPGASGRRFGADDRIFVLPQPGLAVIAPPAYAKLLLPDPAAAESAGSAAAGERWRELAARIDAEDGAMPEDAVLMAMAAGFTPSGSPEDRAGAGKGADPTAAPGASGAAAPVPGLRAPGSLGLPESLTLVVGVAPAPFVEATGSFRSRAAAQAWQSAWPDLKRRLVGNPLLLLSGFLPIVERARLEREERSVLVRTTASTEEMRRVVTTIANLLGPRR